MMAYRWTLPLLSPAIAFTSFISHQHQRVDIQLSLSRSSTQPYRVDQSSSSPLSRKEILSLNQRRLKGLKQRVDCISTINNFLGECYPHMALDADVLHDIDASTSSTWTYEALLSILDKNTTYEHSSFGDDAVIIDGKFLSSILDRVKSFRNDVPISLHFLKLSVDGVLHNRRVHNNNLLFDATDQYSRLSSQDDDNELRKIYKAIFSILAHSNNVPESTRSRVAIHLLQEHMPFVARVPAESEIYHAVLNTLGRCGECDEITRILDAMEQSLDTVEAKMIHQSSNSDATRTYRYPPVDQMAYQTAISSLSKRNIQSAISILYRMKSYNFLPDANCYNVVLIGIAKEAGRARYTKRNGRWHRVALQILDAMKRQGLKPTGQAYDSVIAACGKENAWDAAALVEKIERGNGTDGLSTDRHVNVTDGRSDKNVLSSHDTLTEYFEHLECYRKHNKGADSWWEIGSIERDEALIISIGIQPHRNPTRNGLSLVFHHNTSGIKLGRLLLKNAASYRLGSKREPILYSSIVGMEVHKSLRGQGLSKVFVAIWLKICVATNSYPRAAVMNKPLISLVLMQFGFVPHEGSTCCQLVRLNDEAKQYLCKSIGYMPTFGLYSSSKKSLQGIFSERVLRSQNVALLPNNIMPSERDRGTRIFIKTRFEHPVSIADHVVDYKPPTELKEEFKLRMESSGQSSSQLMALEKYVESTLLGEQLQFFGTAQDLQLAFTKFVA